MKLPRKIDKTISIIRNEGFISFLIAGLVWLKSKVQPKHQRPAGTRLRYHDGLNVSFSKKPPKWEGTSKKTLTFNWVMPPPGKGSGGHMTLFRFIKALEDRGHTNRIYMYTIGHMAAVEAVRKSMGDSFPKLNAPIQWLKDDNKMLPADGIFATSWETAYPIYNSTNKAKRFYFVQDFEPYFYPRGSEYILAENTYRFGFYGVTAGGWLAKKLNQEYGMRTSHFDFGADQEIYSLTNHEKRHEILFYVRPFTERRGFEIGLMALDLFHRRNPDYKINLFGWDVSEYKIPFPFENLKTLEVSELNELYNHCAAGLVLSYTNMSLLPLELLSCGTIPVVNEGENNSLVSNNPYIAFSESTPEALADKLSEIVNKPRGYAEEAAASVSKLGWEAPKQKLVEIIEKETRRAD